MTKQHFDYDQLRFGIGIAMAGWHPEAYNIDCSDRQYWSLFSDFIIKYKMIELPIWHIHSLLNFLEHGKFLQKIPTQATSERELQNLLMRSLDKNIRDDATFILFLDSFFRTVRSTRLFRNKLIHRPFATQSSKIGVCGILNNDLHFEEITMEDLLRSTLDVISLNFALSNIFTGCMNGFAQQNAQTSFEGFHFYPPF